jgi:farnesyl-diphosphate farnesyltransferase
MESGSLLQRIEHVFADKRLPLQVHSEGFSSFLVHPDEAYLAIAFRLGLYTGSPPPLQTPDYLFCEASLKKVSRSFALVIQTLPPDLRVSVCIFYLVLRALDTVEDDMVTFKDKKKTKEKLLRSFGSRLSTPGWKLKGIGEGDEKELVEQFPKVLSVYHSLPKKDQEIIADSCSQMGNGMADFLLKDIRLGTASVEDYNLYCHYVAGVVGEGLTRLFVARGTEAVSLLSWMKEADEMGKFLQKVNIIRDYLEDLQEGRTFWPRDIWSKYVPRLVDLRLGDKEQSLECLNELVIDAYSHLPAVIRYMEQIQDPHVFKFCAIPQVMAIATLERLVNNPDVFTGVVKIRKGLMLSLFQYTAGLEEFKGILSTYSDAILSNLPLHHTAHKKAVPLVYEVQGLCVDGIQPSKPWPSLMSLLVSAAVLVYGYFQTGKRNWMDLLLLATMFLFLAFKKTAWFASTLFPTPTSKSSRHTLP